MSTIEISKQDVINAISDKLASLANICKELNVKDKKLIIYVKRLLNELLKEGKIIKQGMKYSLKTNEEPKKSKTL
ncbi:MAG: hypothetical protein ACTSX4_04290 [Candidatus Helarchaeota archaeon]